MEVVAQLIKLKSGSRDRVREWAATINSRRDEALATLADEGVAIESWFTVTLDDGDYLLSYMRTEDVARSQAAVKESLHAIDAYHQEFKQDTWIRGAGKRLELLVDLDAS